MPLGVIYNLIVAARTKLFERGIFRAHKLGVPVVSIGNITAGGTGKTPLAAFVAKVLASEGRRVCILTRGYKRADPRERVIVSDGKTILAGAKQSGDEPFELANKLLGLSAVIADKDRAAAGNWAKKNLQIDAFVLDDGFQHFKVKRDLDIVAVDAMNPFGNEKVLPSGILRESLKNLKRAGVIVITRANLSPDLAALKALIKTLAPAAVVFVSHNKTKRLAGLNDYSRQNDTAFPVKEKVLAFCALGNPANFFAQLKNEGFDLAETKIFPDHHAYTQKDIAEIESAAKRFDAKMLLTTAKDAVKLSSLDFSLPCLVVESELVFDNESGLRALVTQTLQK